MSKHIQFGIDWSKQHCGLRSASISMVHKHMPDLIPLLADFPEDPTQFSWDIKVHLLMPAQYPCIPDWHCDNVPRVNGIQQFDKVDTSLPMYLWLSGPPLTQFTGGHLKAGVWHRFNQMDTHRGTPAADHGWRGFIRASHIDIKPINDTDCLRRHTQVYLDANNFQW